MKTIVPYLWFKDRAEEAVRFYVSIFKNSFIVEQSHIEEETPSGKDIYMATFKLGGQEFYALEGGPLFSFTPAISLMVACETEEELNHLWEKLVEKGEILMELGEYPFSKKYGWLNDRYGVSWQLILGDNPQKITPFLLFVSNQQGRAIEAIRFYLSIFKDSQLINQEKLTFSLNGLDFMALDGGLEHQFTFSPAISFFVNCETQSEVDYLWEKLSEGGQKQMCGWLQDKYGISWQIIPTILGILMSDPDPAKVKRVVDAMLQMTKLDISMLEKAYHGE
jgi:predicted 3-demethylubiquinone-9 3-methyltransferase (glyoxalase superfamily)